MKKVLVSVLIMMILPAALAEPTDMRNLYEFTDLYNRYLYECRDNYNVNATHDLSSTQYLYMNGSANTSAGMFFLDENACITFCGLESSKLSNDNEMNVFIYRTASAIAALEYSASEASSIKDPVMQTLCGSIFTGIIKAISQDSETIIKSGTSGTIASGNYDYSVSYIDSIGEFAVSATARNQ